MCASSRKEWRKYTKILSFKLSRFLLFYNSTPQTATGISPVELLINRKIKAILDFGIPHQISVTERMKRQQGINNHHKLSSILEFQESDLVLTKNFYTRPKWLCGSFILSNSVGLRNVASHLWHYKGLLVAVERKVIRSWHWWCEIRI